MRSEASRLGRGLHPYFRASLRRRSAETREPPSRCWIRSQSPEGDRAAARQPRCCSVATVPGGIGGSTDQGAAGLVRPWAPYPLKQLQRCNGSLEAITWLRWKRVRIGCDAIRRPHHAQATSLILASDPAPCVIGPPEPRSTSQALFRDRPACAQPQLGRRDRCHRARQCTIRSSRGSRRSPWDASSFWRYASSLGAPAL